MIFRGKHIRDWDEADLKNMCAESEAESISVEFKSEMYGVKREERIEMLKDVSAMTNGYGGLILVGISENEHQASEVVGITGAIEESSRLLKSCRANIQENIHEVSCSVIELESGRQVLAIIVPESPTKPHMVKFENHWRFYRRSGTDNHPIEVQEIREIIINQEQGLERAEMFFEKRVDKLRRKHSGKPDLVLSILPTRLFTPPISFENIHLRSILEINDNDRITQFPFYSGPALFTMNGMRSHWIPDWERKVPAITYEVFSNGYLELHAEFDEVDKIYPKGGWHPRDVLRILLNGAHLLKRFLAHTGRSESYDFRLWAISVDKFKLSEDTTPRYGNPNWGLIDYQEDELIVTSMVKNLSENEYEMVFPIFEQFYRSFNRPTCRYFVKGQIDPKEKLQM